MKQSKIYAYAIQFVYACVCVGAISGSFFQVNLLPVLKCLKRIAESLKVVVSFYNSQK